MTHSLTSGQTLNTQHYSTLSCIMLATCAFLLFSLVGLHAQTNTEYKFRQQSVTDGQAFNGSDPLPILSMGCLAANGTGQWTLSSTAGSGGSGSGATEFPQGWYLLENGLYPPCIGYESGDPINHPHCIPPGVVQCGTLYDVGSTPPSEVKCTANLDGSVYFVWPDQYDRTILHVQYFGPADIDISIAPGFPNLPMIARQVVKTATIHSYTVSTEFSGINHTIVSEESIGGNWKDDYAVSSDAEFLYITWCSTDNSVVIPGGTAYHYISVNGRVLVMAIPLGTSTPSIYPTIIGRGMRPTISCDPRHTRGGGAESFEVAYINTVGGDIGVTGSLIGYQKVLNGSWSSLSTLPGTFTCPFGTYTYTAPLHVCMLTGSVYGGSPTSAIYAIVNMPSNSNTLILYKSFSSSAAFVDGDLEHTYPYSHLDPILGSVKIGVIDGPITGIANPYDNQTGVYDQYHCIYQGIFESGTYNGREPLIIVQGSDISGTSDTRLVLNQVYPVPLTPALLPDDPAIISDGTGSYVAYVAAVNQMGIHVHWRTGGATPTHFYARDMKRTFDELIDENTLVTDQCTVSDGRSHGGTLGATLITNGESDSHGALQMTVWTDPNYGPPSEDGTVGLYSPMSLSTLNPLNPYVGTLNFLGDGVILNVGDDVDHGSGIEFYSPATLTVMPYFYFNFPGSGQGVTINYASNFDYWGLYATHTSLGVQIAIGTPFTDGTADGLGAGTIDLEGYPSGAPFQATLNVHGGADFYTGGGAGAPSPALGGALISNNGYIDVLYEPDLFPATGIPNNPVTGHCTLLGQTTVTDGAIIGNVPYSATDPSFSRRVIMTVDAGYQPALWGTQYQFQANVYTSSGVILENTDPNGTSVFQFGHALRSASSACFNSSEFSGCIGSAIEIHAIDPAYYCNFSVDTCTFENIRNKCIFVENDQNPITSQYRQINIIGNSFGSFASTVDVYSQSDEILDSSSIFVQDPAPFGIYLKNFDDNATGPFEEDFVYYPSVISYNQFTSTSNWNSDLNNISAQDRAAFGTGSSAIALENTTAMVLSNMIYDNGYSAGIGMRVSIPPFAGFVSPPNTYSVICSNTIDGLEDAYTSDMPPDPPDEIAISSNYGAGHNGPSIISLNNISNCDIGIDCFYNDNSFLLYNSVTAYREEALDINRGSIGHLSGNPRLSGAFNSLSGETYDPIEEEGLSVITIEGGGMDLEQGKNNIYYTSKDPYQPWTPLIISSYNSSVNLGDVDGNWWGLDIDPFNMNTPCGGMPCSCEVCWWNTTSGTELDAGGYAVGPPQITYSSTSGGVLTDSSSIPNSAACPTRATYFGDITKKGNIEPMSVTDDTENCDSLRFKIWDYTGPGQTQQCYDTVKKFIETCYNDPWAPSMFQDFSAAWQSLEGTDSIFWLQSQLWLQSVLYLNTTNPEYFCACVEAMQVAPPTDTGGEEQGWINLNKGLAIDEWLVHNTTCDTPLIQNEIYGARSSQYQSWLNDTTVPFDTTIPSIASLGLGLDTLLARHLLYEGVSGHPESFLLTATASPNPVTTGTIITFGLSQEAYLKINLFDILGHEVTSPGFEGLFPPGNHEVPLSLQGLPSGTYYARILTAFGSVATVKLVKEQ